MKQHTVLDFGQFYHIYNHGVGERNLFREANNYEYFLSLYDQYITLVAETYAWVLMPNHFHLLVRIKDKSEVVGNLNLTGFENLTAINSPDRVLNPVRANIPSLQFSKLFNAYAQAYNKYHQTRGALFERPFKRKLLDNVEYLRQAVLYIHNNPVHHGFCSHPLEYPWSSYLTCISDKSTKLKREEVIGWFDGRSNFSAAHEKKIERYKIERWLEM